MNNERPAQPERQITDNNGIKKGDTVYKIGIYSKQHEKMSDRHVVTCITEYKVTSWGKKQGTALIDGDKLRGWRLYVDHEIVARTMEQAIELADEMGRIESEYYLAWELYAATRWLAEQTAEGRVNQYTAAVTEDIAHMETLSPSYSIRDNDAECIVSAA